jgi:hypothetical protein
MSGSRPVAEPQVKKIRKTSKARIVEFPDASSSDVPPVYLANSKLNVHAYESFNIKPFKSDKGAYLRSLFCCFPFSKRERNQEDSAQLLSQEQRPGNTK